ncbi:MAG: hypothetical protein ACK5KS_03850, partial [Planctomyces sp.]
MSLGRLFQSGKSGVPLRTTWLIVCLFLHSAVDRVFGQVEDAGLVLEQKTRTFLHTPENFFDSASQRDL